VHLLVLISFLGAAALSACSRIECDDGELRVGTGCRRLSDANVGPRGSADVEGGRAGSGEDGGADGSVIVSPSAESSSDSSTIPSMAPSLACGNGVFEPANGETCEPSTSRRCPVDCDDGDPCTTDTLVGGESTCNAACEHRFRSPSQVQADGCCPADGDANTDQDCSPICGNGIVEPGERCDGNCPTQSNCEDENPCTLDVLIGSGCGRYCSRGPSQGRQDDGCCIVGETWLDDSACPRAYGCGDSCPASDDPATPGDDRAGYIRCGSGSCLPGTYCFAPIGSATPECREKLGVNLATCDGMEDCPTGSFCFQVDLPDVQLGGAGCGKEISPGYGRQASECHRDADCGSGSMACVPHPRPNRPWAVSWCALR
jgi:hypothetical protein